MTRPMVLEDFADFAAPPGGPGPDGAKGTAQPATQETQLAVYEQGYQSGWDDCAAAEADNNRRIGADLASNLHDLAGAYAEARNDVLTALGPLFEDIAARLLPALAAEAVAPAVIAELRDIASVSSDGRAVLTAAPAALPALERLIDAQEGLHVSVEAEPAFAEGQVAIRFDAERRDIDLTGAVAQMANAIRSFVADNSVRGIDTEGRAA